MIHVIWHSTTRDIPASYPSLDDAFASPLARQCVLVDARIAPRLAPSPATQPTLWLPKRKRLTLAELLPYIRRA